MLLSTSAARPLINNKLIEIEKRVDLVGESQPDETCMRVREKCVWAFYGAKSVLENHCDPYKAFQDFCPNIYQESFLGSKGD